ncbi:unnamed protein product [Bursaphelenchus xylophilus]|uniref:(pine wood nematode) hypothetical protein n=1 Tax=Bursaphelenchus xylophilus TaxID=6326 RepID=A0A1I7SBF0_BURXY|nr:unnamed protein product [Bursaphelenchus xylophilus]CAG9122043.1 unnamed protein product [Bursaphelenchus xylophilus]
MVDGRPASSVFEEKLERTVFCRVFFGWTKTEGCVMDRGIWESDKTDLSALLWGWPSKFGGVRGGGGMQIPGQLVDCQERVRAWRE